MVELDSSASRKRVLIVAGEASGDQHGAQLLADLKLRLGEFKAFGLGGQGLEAAGTELLADVSEISVVGFAEVLRVLPKARRIFRKVLERARAERPDVAVLIDFPEFNLRLAPALRDLGIKVAYYVSPQVWAWRSGRVRSMARSIDKMLVFFPFELDFYRDQVDATHVGHPIVDQVPELPQTWDDDAGDLDRESALRVALLPGSRSSEVKRLLPLLLRTVRILRSSFPNLEATLIEASTVQPDLVSRILAENAVEVRRLSGAERFETVAGSHAALCASGTATLEVGLLRVPMVVVYKISAFGYQLGRHLVQVPFISLVNLVLGKAVVPELIQNQAEPEIVARHVLALLENKDHRHEMIAGLRGLRAALGESGASGRAADEIARMVTNEALPA